MENAETSGDPYDLLTLIPVFALRQAAEAADPDGGYGSLDGEELRARVRKTRILSAADVRQLFETWRYGDRPAFALALFLREVRLPEALKAPVQGKLDQGAGETIVLDEDRTFDPHVIEMSFRYAHTYHFVDPRERPASIEETRYGFFWISEAHRFAAVSGSEEVGSRILQAVGSVVGQQPIRVSISKDALDKHFPLSAISSIAHVDPNTRIRHRVSGSDLKSASAVFREITRRDLDEHRTGALYGQELSDGRHINVGVNAPLGRLYLTGPISATDVREWALPRLKQLTGALHELRKSHPDAFNDVVRVTRGLIGVPPRYAAAVQAVLLALVECRAANLTEFPLAEDAAALAQRLPSKFGRLSTLPHCARCDEVVGVTCGICGGEAVELMDGRVQCVACGMKDDLRCERGHHPAQTALREGFHFSFGPAMLTALSDGLSNLGLPGIDRTRERLAAHGAVLWRVDRGLIPGGVYTCVYVDLRSSTDLLARDEAAYRTVTGVLRDIIQSVAEQHEGRYANDTGDGGFALFSDARQGILAALAIDSTARKSREIPEANRPRIGLGTDRVWTRGGAFSGLAINIAARLQDKAREHDAVLIDEGTRSAARLGHLRRIGALAGLAGLGSETGGYYGLPRRLTHEDFGETR